LLVGMLLYTDFLALRKCFLNYRKFFKTLYDSK
jgi:hypothetical protein